MRFPVRHMSVSPESAWSALWQLSIMSRRVPLSPCLFALSHSHLQRRPFNRCRLAARRKAEALLRQMWREVSHLAVPPRPVAYLAGDGGVPEQFPTGVTRRSAMGSDGCRGAIRFGPRFSEKSIDVSALLVPRPQVPQLRC